MVLLLDKLPLISLYSYSLFSVLLLVGAVLHALDTIPFDADDTLVDTIQLVLEFLVEDSKCFWALANFAYCLLVLFGNYIQKIVFGELRVFEADHFRQKFWNYVFYKFIFVFGVISGEHLDSLVIWSAWFSIIGFLLLLVQLGKERFDYLQMSVTSAELQHRKLVFLLFGILLISTSLLGISCVIGQHLGLQIFFLLAPECVLLMLRSSHVLLRQKIRQRSNNHGTTLTNLDLLFDVSILVVDLLHHLHLMVTSHLVLSMSSLVILLQIRLRANQLYLRVKKHMLVRKVRLSLRKHCQSELVEDETCSICWEGMSSAVRLECKHLYHEDCIQTWLEQDFTCPTCRQPPWKEENASDSSRRPADNNRANWFTSLVYRLYRLSNRRQRDTSRSPLDQVIAQVQEVLPNHPRHLIIAELIRTNSVEETITNLLDSQRSEEPLHTGSLEPGPSSREDLNLFEPGASSASPSVVFSNRFSESEVRKRQAGRVES